MFIDIKINNEFHKNGQLAYTETIAVLAPLFAHLYPNRRGTLGNEWIRTGKNAKYFDNGQLAWQLNYDKNGNLIKENIPSFRKDGTVIIY